MTEDLIAQLYSSDSEVKRAAVYRVLFDRRHDLLPELKKAASYEQNEEIAVFMVQVCLTLEAFPRDALTERRIIEVLQKPVGAAGLTAEMWKYLASRGSSQMMVATLGAMGDAIPPDAQQFVENCLNHPDPGVRSMACEKAIKSGRPTHFAYVLNLIADPDPVVAQTAFDAVRQMPPGELAIILDYSLGSPDEWVLDNVAPFLPKLINHNLRSVIAKVQYHKHPLVAQKAREAIKLLDSIPYRPRIDDDKSLPEADAEDKVEKKQHVEAVEEKKVPSFREQMEAKRLQKIEAEQQKKAEEEALADQLANVEAQEMLDFEQQLREFDAIPGVEPEQAEDVPLELVETMDLADAAVADGFFDTAQPDNITLDEIDFEKASEQICPEPSVNSESASASTDEITVEFDATDSEATFSEEFTLDKSFDVTESASDACESVGEEEFFIESPEALQKDADTAQLFAETIETAPCETFEFVDDATGSAVAGVEPDDAELSEFFVGTSQPSAEKFEISSSEACEFADDLSEPAVEESVEVVAEPDADVLEFLTEEIKTPDEKFEVPEESTAFADIEPAADLTEFSESLAENGKLSFEEPEEASDLSFIDLPSIDNVVDLSMTSDFMPVVDESLISFLDSVEEDMDILVVDENTSEPVTAHLLPSETPSAVASLPPLAPSPAELSEPSAIKSVLSAAKAELPGPAREIAQRYPSFLVDPLFKVFEAAAPEEKLKHIEQVLDNLTAFLNLCFLQSCLYFAPESEVLSQSVRECLKTGLVGPAAFRCLRNFALSMKAARHSPVFFTFSLAGVFGESSETNPLLLMRELKEYLRSPEEPVSETLPQAVDGLIEILLGVKSILANKLVMKAPAGAREPFADLSGPEATVLAADKRPALELPPGEVVLVSRDGTEALGLFPYFKYARKKIVFARPDNAEIRTLYERLEISVD